MSEISRRELIAWLATLPIAQAALAAERALRASALFTPKFFTPHEWRTVRVLADYIIPRDERSGSATDAGVPEFMDFIMTDRPQERLAMRGGLRWLDNRCRDQFNATFADCTPAQQTSALDHISSPPVEFFTMFRDLTATGFWSSKMGVADLRYIGNTVVHEWNGCPDAALAKLGVSY
ncbi:MAG TPA: gluconate 2-dehydrogenase subunit 3 family protein [Gemmatimonadaceae bacterium]|nr:gluconate 2-dehydrogenase subunit 3 family protein [Gemmatimonadaceae bacterium]